MKGTDNVWPVFKTSKDGRYCFCTTQPLFARKWTVESNLYAENESFTCVS